MKKNALLGVIFVMAALAVFPAFTAAQPDPPSRVARLNYIQGSVSFQLSGQQDWVQANPNRPLTTGDNVWADKNSRGELHIGSTAIRLASETGLSFLTLDDRTAQLQLAQGQIQVHLRHLSPGDDFEIDTRNLAFTLTRAGEYVIAADPDGDSTKIIVREGEGQVTGGGDSWELREGQQYTLNGTQELSYDAAPAPGYDEFEDWCAARSERENRALAARYVSRDIDGYYDLDDYGDWQSNPDYGMVWVPRAVPVGWVPYHYGHWVFIEPWGWTWVDEAPWGFAPFHYGRWCLLGAGWVWVPGPIVVRPVYAPALVAFVGGGGFSFSMAFGGGFTGVAWFPLGPRDVFVPAYRCSARYVQNVNITNTRIVNVTQVTNVYNNVVIHRSVTNVNYTYANNAGAVTAVSKETFVNARPVGGAAVRVTSEQIQRARVVESAPVAPSRTSYISSTATPAASKPGVPIAQRPVVVRLTPSPETQHGAQPSTPSNPTTFRQGAQPPRAFHPPQGSMNNTPPPSAERPTMRYTPPVKARDEMYDVHEPLNRKPPQAAPKPEERHSQPPRQTEGRRQSDESPREK